MTLKNLFTVNAVVAILYGLGFLLVPETVLSLYGLDLSAGGLIITQYLGTAFIGFAVLMWLQRTKEHTDARRAVVLGFLIHFVIGLVLSVISALSGVMNALGWLNVVIYLVFTMGYGYFQFVNTSDM